MITRPALAGPRSQRERVGVRATATVRGRRVASLLALAGAMTLAGAPAALAAPPEAPVTKPPTAITATSATANAELNPKAAGKAGEFSFTYKQSATECEPAGTIAPQPPGASLGAEKEPVSTELTGLQPNTKYTYCAIATHAGESAKGLPEPFTTLALAPSIDSESVSAVTLISATLEAQVNPNNEPTKACTFEYGTLTVGEHTKACSPATIEGSGDQLESAAVTGLEPGAIYHYRVVVGNATGKTEGGETEFSTLPRASSTSTFSEVTAGSAKLEGTITLNVSGPVKYHFEYASSLGAVENTPTEELSGEGEHTVAAPVSALEPSIRYSVRLIVEAEGHEYVSETAFTTLGLNPVVTANAATHVTRTTASVSGEVNPRNDETAWFVEYGETTAYGKTTTVSLLALGSGNALVPVGPTVLEELKPSTTYHYRLVATDATGTEYSADRTLTTLPAQPPAIETQSGQASSQSTATILAQINPDGLPTSYTLEMGPDTSYGTSLSGHLPENGHLELALSGLLPGTVYHFRLIVTNPDGTVAGPDMAFTTPGFPQTLQPPAPVTIIPFSLPAANTTHTTTHKTKKNAKKKKKPGKHKHGHAKTKNTKKKKG